LVHSHSPPMYGVYFNDSACNDTTAKLGYYSLAMDWATTGYTAVALKVSPAMQAGHAYTGSFWYSASLYFSSCNFQLGYSADSSTFGTLINSYFAPGVFVINWQQGTFTFTPTVNCNWITIQTTSSTQNSTFSPYMYTLLDAFSLDGSTAVKEVTSSNSAIRISPNPAKDVAYISFDNSVFQNNVTLTVSDMTGRSIQQNKVHLDMGANNIQLNLENISAGMYLVNITNGKESATQKIVLTR
jgi:hypothetical protein